MDNKAKVKALELIRENKGFKETKAEIEKEGGKISSAAFYRMKQDINPTVQMGELLKVVR
jgi:hypothetical protein